MNTVRPRGYEFARSDGIKADVRRIINDLRTDKQWPLTLSGSVGTGKTAAAACLFGSFVRRPMWHRADDLLLSIAMGRVNGVQIETIGDYGDLMRRTIPFGQFVSRIDRASCVFLDDLGTRSPTESMYQALFDLMEWRSGKPLVITTNKSLGDIAMMYDDRIASRLRAGTVVLMAGEDRRARGHVIRIPT